MRSERLNVRGGDEVRVRARTPYGYRQSGTATVGLGLIQQAPDEPRSASRSG
jgi:hypothetical protein